MIRVNLLPYRQQRKRSAGKAQLALFAGVFALEIVVVLSLWIFATYDLEREQSRVTQYQQEVATAKEEVKDAQQLEAQKAQLQKQLSVLDRLEAQRSGPVRVLDEFQAMMSPPRNEEDRFAQLQKNWNVDWDPRRLWVEKLAEKDGRFSLNGSAVNADDVAEFLQRMATAEYFDNVELDIVEAKEADGTPTVTFKIRGDIVYAGRSSGLAPEGS
jgi:type IV pilus assembly protein PilN